MKPYISIDYGIVKAICDTIETVAWYGLWAVVWWAMFRYVIGGKHGEQIIKIVKDRTGSPETGGDDA